MPLKVFVEILTVQIKRVKKQKASLVTSRFSSHCMLLWGKKRIRVPMKRSPEKKQTNNWKTLKAFKECQEVKKIVHIYAYMILYIYI